MHSDMETTTTNALSQITNLSHAISCNSSWIPQFTIESTHFMHSPEGTEQTTCLICPNYDSNVKHIVNLSHFEDKRIYSSPILSSFRSSVLNYPPNTAIQIEGFVGLEAEVSVIRMLKDAAALGGTVLVIDSTRKPRR